MEETSAREMVAGRRVSHRAIRRVDVGFGIARGDGQHKMKHEVRIDQHDDRLRCQPHGPLATGGEARPTAAPFPARPGIP
jgi:hypothetical protein